MYAIHSLPSDVVELLNQTFKLPCFTMLLKISLIGLTGGGGMAKGRLNFQQTWGCSPCAKNSRGG